MLNQKLRTLWIVVAVAIGCLTGMRVHAVVWIYSSTDDTTTISGQFETDGVFADTQGTGTHEFTISTWTSWKLNGEEIIWNGVPPAQPTQGNSFQWDRGSSSVVLSPDSDLRLDAASSASTIVQIAFPGDKDAGDDPSLLFGFVNTPPLAVSFTPTSTSLTPVPEPSEYAIVFLFLIGGLITLRRHNQSVSKY
jgi:hypothetical protein